MRCFIANFLCWILRKLKVTVLIGVRIKPEALSTEIQELNDTAFIYNNNFTNCKFSACDGTEHEIPRGKFKYTFKIKQTEQDKPTGANP